MNLLPIIQLKLDPPTVSDSAPGRALGNHQTQNQAAT